LIFKYILTVLPKKLEHAVPEELELEENTKHFYQWLENENEPTLQKQPIEIVKLGFKEEHIETNSPSTSTSRGIKRKRKKTT
jgi:hypothetical protein